MKRGDYPICKWCEFHGQEHGPLYLCDSYGPELRAEIEAESSKWEVRLRDTSWCRQQVEAGLSPHAITIYRIFAGIEDLGDGF